MLTTGPSLVRTNLTSLPSAPPRGLLHQIEAIDRLALAAVVAAILAELAAPPRITSAIRLYMGEDCHIEAVLQGLITMSPDWMPPSEPGSKVWPSNMRLAPWRVMLKLSFSGGPPSTASTVN